MKATDIQWDIDMDEVYEKLDDMSCENASEALGVSYRQYADMTTGERHDLAYDIFRHSPGALFDFLGLPEEVEIPEEVGDNEEDISNWLSDTFGYCHEGFGLPTDEVTENV